MISTAATSSMNTPVLLIRAISCTPIALTTVVNTIRIAPQTTRVDGGVGPPVPSPTSWKPDQICGSASW